MLSTSSSNSLFDVRYFSCASYMDSLNQKRVNATAVAAQRTSNFFSHKSRSCSTRCTCRSKCSAFSSTCRSLIAHIAHQYGVFVTVTKQGKTTDGCHRCDQRVKDAQEMCSLLYGLLNVLLCGVKLIFEKLDLAQQTLVRGLAVFPLLLRGLGL